MKTVREAFHVTDGPDVAPPTPTVADGVCPFCGPRDETMEFRRQLSDCGRKYEEWYCHRCSRHSLFDVRANRWKLDLNDVFRHAHVMASSPRERLAELLAGGDTERGRAILDALDEYLSDDYAAMSPTLTVSAPNAKSELDVLRAERDAAIARAEKAEKRLLPYIIHEVGLAPKE